MCIVDPMHNLLLGTSKRMVEIWKCTGILEAKDFDEIQKHVDNFQSPNDIGRLPYKISSGFSGFTAEQWKNWTCFFSLPALKGVLPFRHYRCWQLFVKACYLLCRRTLTVEQLQQADELLLQFCSKFVDLYGKESCIMNLHLQGHLSACVEDFGPLCSFWLFSYERMNGILGSYHTNNHSISVQLMQKFWNKKMCAVHNWPEEFCKEYFPLLEKCNYSKGSLAQTTFETMNGSTPPHPLPRVKNRTFSEDHITSLRLWTASVMVEFCLFIDSAKHFRFLTLS